MQRYLSSVGALLLWGMLWHIFWAHEAPALHTQGRTFSYEALTREDHKALLRTIFPAGDLLEEGEGVCMEHDLRVFGAQQSVVQKIFQGSKVAFDALRSRIFFAGAHSHQPERVYLLLETTHLGHKCHACGSGVGLAIAVRNEEGWKVDKPYHFLWPMGAWGHATSSRAYDFSVGLLQLTPQTPALVLQAVDSYKGYKVHSLWVCEVDETSLKEVWSYCLQPADDCKAHGVPCTQQKISLRPLPEDGEGKADILEVRLSKERILRRPEKGNGASLCVKEVLPDQLFFLKRQGDRYLPLQETQTPCKRMEQEEHSHQ